MDGFTPEQLQQLEATVRRAVKEELSDAGLRLDDATHQDEAREDFRLLRKMRKGIEGVSSKIGWAVILAILGGVVFVFDLGIKAWRAGGGG